MPAYGPAFFTPTVNKASSASATTFSPTVPKKRGWRAAGQLLHIKLPFAIMVLSNNSK
jgi:hypothetical protein